MVSPEEIFKPLFLCYFQELAMRLCTSIENEDNIFYTDVNGFQLIRRQTYSKLPLQGNFYPMPTMAMLQDGDKRITLLSAQPLGVAALKKGLFVFFQASGTLSKEINPAWR